MSTLQRESQGDLREAGKEGIIAGSHLHTPGELNLK